MFLSAVHSFTQRNPRLIDNLMTDALTIGYGFCHSLISRAASTAPQIRLRLFAVIPLEVCGRFRFGTMCIYDTGSRTGLINTLSEMRKELSTDEAELCELTDSTLNKLSAMSD